MHIILKFSLPILFIINSHLAYLQTTSEEIASQIKTQCDAFVTDINNSNYEAYADKTYRPLLELSGGRVAFVANTKSIKEAFKQAGFIYSDVKFEKVSEVVQAANEWHAIVTYNYMLKMGENKFGGKLHYLAIQQPEDQKWYFVDLESFDKVSIKDFIPSYNHELVFPELEEPYLIEDKK